MSVTIERLKQAKDAALIRLFQLGNNKAFDVLVLRYEKMLRAYIHTLLHNSSLEKDVLQNLWYAAIRQIRLHRYAEKGNFIKWLRTLAYHLVVSAKRREKPMERATDEMAIPDGAGETDDGSDFYALQIQQVKEALAKMNKNYHDVIRMRLEEDLPFREIASQTGDDIHTVTSRYSKAIKKLRKVVSNRRK